LIDEPRARTPELGSAPGSAPGSAQGEYTGEYVCWAGKTYCSIVGLVGRLREVSRVSEDREDGSRDGACLGR
jgi:hypothetical protein